MRGHGSTRFVFVVLPLRERFARTTEILLASCPLGGCLLSVCRDPRAVCFALVCFELRALASRECIALALFGDGHLAANLLHTLALRRKEAQELRALCLGGGAVPMRHVPGLFGGEDRATKEVGDVAKAAGCSIEEILTFA